MSKQILKLWEKFTVIQVATGSISFVCSSVVAIMTAREQRPSGGNEIEPTTASALYNSPYHRIIFGLSISDCFQSFAMFTGPFAIPSNVMQAKWSRGNDLTCRTTGFIFTMGSLNTPMYTLFLCFYFYCKITKQMTDSVFSKTIEWKIHSLILVLNPSYSVASLVTNTLTSNVLGTFCGPSAGVPIGCRLSPQIFGECDESIASIKFIDICTFYRIIVFLFCFAGIVLFMARVCWHALVKREQVFRGMRSSLQSSSMGSGIASDITRSSFLRNSLLFSSSNVTPSRTTLKNSFQSAQTPNEPREDMSSDVENATKSLNFLNTSLPNYLNSQVRFNSVEKDLPGVSAAVPGATVRRNKSELLVRLRRREFIFQALLYVAAYFATYGLLFINNVIVFFRETSPPAWLVVMTCILYPLGGMFNMLVYTRPKIGSIRRRNKNISWIRAFILVVGGGEIAVEKRGSERQQSNKQRRSGSSVDQIDQISAIDTPSLVISNALLSGISLGGISALSMPQFSQGLGGSVGDLDRDKQEEQPSLFRSIADPSAAYDEKDCPTIREHPEESL